ncbi:quinoprotein relay system zinc metallohydrolase 2 [Microvirga sp. TS319]|uniref:quinoprotein relay system zinc metallohydrolase 2 n=1 Tax=Microvirga sp. TS319 TaxID=3241165 RepID=UPI00351A96A2
MLPQTALFGSRIGNAMGAEAVPDSCRCGPEGPRVAPGRIACLYALVLSVGAVASSGPSAEEANPFPVTEIAAGVFVYEAPIALADANNLGAIANLGFVIGEDGVAVIDTGGSLAAGQRLLAAIRERTDLPIRYVVNTHVHPDHVLGNAAFEGSGVTFVGHRNLPQALADRAKTYLAANSALIGAAFAGTSIVPPTRLAEDVVEIDLGRRKLRVEAWRTAHTNTDVTVLDEATSTWFLGDLLFIGHVPALDGSLAGWIRTLNELRARPVARVVPGHGPSAAPWPAAADLTQHYLAALQADVRTSIRQGHTIGEVARQAAQRDAGPWLLFNQFNARNAVTAFHELEWE